MEKTIKNEAAKQEIKYVWGLSEDDFLVLMQESYPNLNDQDKQWIIAEAKDSFSIYDWSDYVLDFIELCIEELSKGTKEVNASYDGSVKNHEYVWGIANVDFEIYLLAKTPILSKEEIAYVIESAKSRFSIDDWSDYVREFISNRVDYLKTDNK